MIRLLTPFVLLIAALAVVIRLDNTPADADLVFVNQNEVFTLDPQRMSYLADLRLAHVLYEGLVRWDNEDFSILPGVAESWSVSDDGLRYSFRLRPDARWSNGDPVTAHDFVYSWSRAILPDSAADYSNMFFVIDGGQAFFEWRVAQTTAFAANPWSQIEDTDAGTVLAAVDRLETLLAAPDLPAAIEVPAGTTRRAIEAELRRLRAAASRMDPVPAIELEEAPRTRGRALCLLADDTRHAEAQWWWHATERRFASTVGLHAVDARTLEVRLARPTAYFLDLLCFGVFFPLHRPTVEGWPAAPAVPAEGWHTMTAPPFAARRWINLSPTTARIEQRHEWARPGRHVGNGTHLLAEWRYKRDLRLEPNPRYWDPGRVRSRSILALTIEDTNTAVLAFESGRVDWLADVSAEYQADMLAEAVAYRAAHAQALAELAARGVDEDEALATLPPPRAGQRRNIHVFPTFGTDFYSFNCRPTLANGNDNPLADARVRRAFALSVDKETIVRQVTRLDEPVLTTLIPPGSIEGYRSPSGLGYDPGAARRELAAAGWEDRDGDGLVENAAGRGFPVIDLLYTTNIPRYKWISLELKAQWERELGVRIELRGEETKFYKEDLKLGEFMIARGRWYGDYGDPTTFLDLCRSTDGNNDRRYASDYVDGLLDAAAVERDPVRRMELLHECERFLVQEAMPMVPLCQLVQVYMYEPGQVTGLSRHPRLTQFLWKMKVDDQ